MSATCFEAFTRHVPTLVQLGFTDPPAALRHTVRLQRAWLQAAQEGMEQAFVLAHQALERWEQRLDAFQPPAPPEGERPGAGR